MTTFDWAAWGGVALTLIGSFSVFLMSSEKEVQPRLIAYMIVFFGVGLVFRRSFSTQLVFATVLTGTISAVILGTGQRPDQTRNSPVVGTSKFDK